ncbi:pilus assembly protein TadG-related protein [Nocardioides jiangxiensis]|uniref:Pilus assembly protein TadG-related protein n=1 Tax=Nocardioides jiangxiensis TaxID=3064524 RepID=A0ABT9B3K3_9ACTN|nr:pilus assembly protein TadG-related protein [Nocardioides sp. WY-20]MDO7868965.1 pilus assembly protein TadG-related protein [Nocardioides sp. WY-20]
MSRRAEAGQVTVLVVGFALVLLLAVGVTVDASAAYLQRESLATLADGAALAAADQVQGAPAYDGGLAALAPVDVRTARASVAAHLRAAGAERAHPGIVATVSVVEGRVVVRLRAPLDLPLTVEGLTATTVSAIGSASVVLRGE